MDTARWVLALALAVGASTAALANHCPVDMQQIDAALAANSKLSAEQLAEVKKLRAEGEAQHNVVPDEAYLALDIRTAPGQDHVQIEAEINRIARSLEAATSRLRFEVECFESRPWTATDPTDPLVAAVEAAYPEVLGTAPRYGGVPGATDGTFLWALKDIPIVTIGPGDKTIPHQVNEFVRLADTVAAARLYAAAAVIYLHDL